MYKIIIAGAAAVLVLGVGAYFLLPTGFFSATNPPSATIGDSTTPPTATSTQTSGKIVLGKAVEG